MTDNEKKELNACIENVEAVQEFLEDWYSVADLYETAANASNVLLEQLGLYSLAEEDRKYLTALLDQHIMMTNLLKKFKSNGEK
jgi:hypothetical protein